MKTLDGRKLEYIRSLIPRDLPDGRALVQEGLALGRTLQAGRSRFVRENGYRSFLEYRQKCRAEGRIVWQTLMGLATLREQVEAIRKVHEFSRRTGLELNLLQMIPSPVVALPRPLREKAPKTTSYLLDGFEDWQAHVEAAPIEIIFGDFHLSCPNALETTVNALRVGSSRIGEFSQFFWNHAGFSDDLQRFSDMLRALGVMASKREEHFTVETYLDDGLPSYFLDCASFAGYALLEHYLCTQLCGARYSVSFGGLLSEGDMRMGLAMALSKLLSTADQPVLSYVNSSTTMQWDHDLPGNYGISVQEFLFEILVERKYRMGMGIQPVSVTEALQVPTLQDLLDIFTAGKRAEEKAGEWERYMDFTALERIRDQMADKAVIFFRNILESFREAGVDTGDPLQMLMVLKRFNAGKFEGFFHPTVEEGGEVRPYFPTPLARQAIEARDRIIETLRKEGCGRALAGKKIVVASADVHTYGLILVEGVLSAAGAEVVNGGVDLSPEEVLELADREKIRHIGISAHNGQALDYGKRLLELAAARGGRYHFFMGGKLNAILPGQSEPTDIAHRLRELGIQASNDLPETVRAVQRTK